MFASTESTQRVPTPQQVLLGVWLLLAGDALELMLQGARSFFHYLLQLLQFLLQSVYLLLVLSCECASYVAGCL